jgi:hypothetical protein
MAKGARRVQKTAPSLPVIEALSDELVVGTGPHADYRSADVLSALADGIDKLFSGESEDGRAILGEAGADLPTAGSALDLALGRYLQMVDYAIGPHNAKAAALAFIDTALPFATSEVPVVTSYADARRLKGAK